MSIRLIALLLVPLSVVGRRTQATSIQSDLYSPSMVTTLKGPDITTLKEPAQSKFCSRFLLQRPAETG
jgi:hypothetical protein